MPFVGEITALAAAACWSFGTILWGEAGKKVGAFITNSIRVPMALIFLGFALLISKGYLWPTWATPNQVGYLALSAFIGLVLGDSLYFHTILLLGPRRASLFGTLVPMVSAFFAWIILHESLSPLALVGMLITMAGVAWVVTERSPENNEPRNHVIKGLLFGLGATCSQGLAMVVTKLGMGDTLDALSASYIRMMYAMIGLLALTVITGRMNKLAQAFRDRTTVKIMSAGAFVGPFLGVWFILVALQNAEVGVAMTLSGTSPVLVIPLVMLIYKEKTSARAWLGACLAVLGIALLFIR